MKRKAFYKIVSLILTFGICLAFVGCSGGVEAENLMSGITPNDVSVPVDLSVNDAKVTDFAVHLLKACEKRGESVLISPLSVLSALAMTANGAEKETLEEMQLTLGMKVEDLNLYLHTYTKNLPQNEKNKLSLANSIWFTSHERFTVNQDFLQKTADYYKADIFKADFNNQTLKDINNWVKEKTDDMIPEILDNISDNAVMYLVNALAFDAEWSMPYTKKDVTDGKFTMEDTTVQNAKFMHSEESTYIKDEKATGFMKFYKDSEYAFVALLPNEGISVSDYISTLDGKTLNEMLKNPKHAILQTSIPKFEKEYDLEMSSVLKEMGMKRAFDSELAEFGGLGTSTSGTIYINRVLHKTFISVGEKGTKAGAATVVETYDKGMAEGVIELHLNRPFVYMLVDCENYIPFFIGTVYSVE